MDLLEINVILKSAILRMFLVFFFSIISNIDCICLHKCTLIP